MPTLSTVLLSIKGEARKANLTLNENSNLTIETLQKYLKKKDEPERICYYEHDNKVIFVFGYKKGKKGTENKSELPDPYSGLELFGDALVIASQTTNWESPVPFTVDQWENLSRGGGGEDEDDEEDSEDEEEGEEAVSEDESISDDFDNDDDSSTKSSIIDEEPEPEETPPPPKRRRAAALAKTDAADLKEEIPITSEPESNKLRTLCLNNLKFLEDQFSGQEIRELEHGIFVAAYAQAHKHYIPRNWKSATFVEIYRQIVRSVFSNIHPDSPVKNPRLLTRVLDGEFKLHEIPSMSSYEMFPEKWFELRDKQLQREQKILEGNKSRATDQFKCRRCGKRECTYYELQTRSADEPMTIFVTCLNCGKEWRNGG
jgi:transcription elongation factor S-II